MSEHDNEVLKTETAQGESTDWENQKHGFPTEGAFPDSGVKRCLACGSVIAKSGDDELDDEPIVCAVWNVGDILIEYDCTDSEAVAWLKSTSTTSIKPPSMRSGTIPSKTVILNRRMSSRRLFAKGSCYQQTVQGAGGGFKSLIAKLNTHS